MKVIVGMSGGVDSSVAALRLIDAGYNVSGLFMKNWEEDDNNGQCTASADLADAQQVCDKLGISLKTVNFSAEYWDDVFEVFLEEHRAGRTPNPDILCNKHIKFKAFMQFATALGADAIATGHYARISNTDGNFRLLKGTDSGKDQSYFLYTLGQSVLRQCLFPLGNLNKSEVRVIAEEAGFENHEKKDSTGICFIGERKFRFFLKRFISPRPGRIETPEGRTIGQHEGLMYYTLGQRQGLGIGGVNGASEKPWYVVEKDIDRNVLIAAQDHDHPALLRTTLIAGDLDWVSGQALARETVCKAKIRYRQADQACRVSPLSDGRCRAVFERPQRAITAGQSVVFYHDDVCLGGGIIESAISPEIPALRRA